MPTTCQALHQGKINRKEWHFFPQKTYSLAEEKIYKQVIIIQEPNFRVLWDKTGETPSWRIKDFLEEIMLEINFNRCEIQYPCISLTLKDNSTQ